MTPFFTFSSIRSRLAPLVRPILERCPPVRFVAVSMLKMKQSGRLRRCGMEFTLPCGDFGVTLEAESTGSYEPLTTATIESILKEGMTFVDVGAHVGLFSLPALHWVGNSGKVISFEPHPDNYVMLLDNASRNQLDDRLIAVQSAVSDKNEIVKLHTSTFNTGDHQLFHRGARDSIEVECTTLDHYFPVGTKVDVIKMDVQGAEAKAFSGMERVLADNSNVQIIWELSPSQLEDAGSSASEVLHWLANLDFTFSSIDESKQTLQERTIEEILRICPHDSFLNILSSRNE
jgi:FkbM family methyltransferase